MYCLIQDYILSHRDIDECYLVVKDLLYQVSIEIVHDHFDDLMAGYDRTRFTEIDL